MDKHMRMQSVTFYTHLGEDESGQARWLVTRLDDAFAFVRKGAKQHPRQALRGGDTLTLYLFENAQRVRRDYLPPDAFDALDDRDGHWTVHPDGRDRVYLGLSYDAAPPPEGRVFRPMRVTENFHGRAHTRHLKIECGV